MKSRVSVTVNWFCLLLWNNSAIQNAPNPGGGDLQRAARLSPLKVQPRKLPCRGQTACRGSCTSGEGRGLGRAPSQIENTPALCPFHLQPVPEYGTFSFLGPGYLSVRDITCMPPPPLPLRCRHTHRAALGIDMELLLSPQKQLLPW